MKITVLISVAAPLFVICAARAEEQRLNPDFAEYAMVPEVRKEHEQLVLAIKYACEQLEDATSRKAFSDPSAASYLTQLSSALVALRLAHTGGFPVPGGEKHQETTHQQLGFRHTLNMRNLLAEIDFKVNKLTMELTTRLLNGELPKRYNTLSKAVQFLNEGSYADTLTKMDNAYENYLKSVEEMGRNKRTDVYGTALLASSKLDAFCDSEMRLKPFYDNTLRVIDRYLEQLKEDEIRECNGRFTDLMETCEKLNQALDEARIAFHDKKAPPVPPNDRKLLLRLLDSYLKFWGGSQEMAMNARELIKTARDTSTNVGKIRANHNLGKGALLYRVSSSRTPHYHDMVTRTLKQGRDYYLTTVNKYILRIWR